MMIWVLFISSVAIELIYILLFVLTIQCSHFQFWPPPSWHSWQFFTAWLMAGVVAVIFLLLGLLDFDSAGLPHFGWRWPAAVFLFILGTSIGLWTYPVFGLRATLGLGNRMVVQGPYRYTRNPQYIGDSINILGYMVLMNSWMVWVIGALGLALNILAPFAEEPWLEARYGESYRKYKQAVPRFFGRKRKIDPIE